MKQGELFAEEPGRAGGRTRARTPLPGARPPEPRSGAREDADARARRLAATCFDRPLLVEAGAGTGKTATLVARIVCWATTRGWEEAEAGDAESERIAGRVLRGIVAITFTEAAAAEMSTRVGRALGAIQRLAAERELASIVDADLPRGLSVAYLPGERSVWHERARALRAALDQLTVCTIHAFCRRLLAAHPLEARLAPDFAIDPAYTAIDLVLREVLEELLQERWRSGDDADFVALALRGWSPPQVEETLRELVRAGARAEDFEPDPLGEPECQRLCDELLRSLQELAPLAAPLELVHKNPTAVETAAALGASGTCLERREASARATFERWRGALLELWGQRLRLRLETWRKGRVAPTEASALGERAQDLCRAAVAFERALEPFLEVDPERLESGRRIVREVLGRLERELRARGLSSFSDLLRDAHRCLALHPSIAAGERRALRQLLVDEFQDTDAVQCEIVRLLGLGAEERPGLFVVGDPKQSIYAWRNADLASYDAFKELLTRSGGEVLPLTRNFRSVPAILEEVGRVLAPLMLEQPGLQPAFVPLEPTVGKSGREPAGVEYWVSWPRDPASDELFTDVKQRAQSSYAAEARAIAADLHRLHEAGTPWKEGALLLRSLTGVEVYLRALRECHIPYEVQSDRHYYQRREVVDATALVRTVLDPNDQLALVTFLRSPAVGVPDAALLPLWSERFPELVARLSRPDQARLGELAQAVAAAAAKVAPDLPGLEEIAGWEESLLAALAALAEARERFHADPADVWVERLRALFLGEACEAARFLGAFRLSNLSRFFRELVLALEERAGDAQSLLRTLRTNLSRERESEVTPPASERDAVRVLSVHGAKGLEFAHVYLCQTHRPSRIEEGDETQFEGREGLVSYAFFGTRTPSHTEAAARRRESEAAERVRLLYVAMTRAAQRLVVLGSWKPGNEADPWERCRTFADLLEHRADLAPSLRTLEVRGRERSGEPALDAHGVLWKLAALAERPPRIEAQDDASLPSPAQVVADERFLAERRAWAARHGARPLSRAASEDAHLEWRDAREGARTDAPIGRDAAQAAGSAVHRALECLALDGEATRALDRGHEALPELVRAALDGADRVPALERARELWQRFRSGPLCSRLFALKEHVLSRELPVLLAPAEDPAGPVGFVAGAIDLLYSDPESGELVVADYKTDRVESEPELRERAEAYRPQGRLYVRAVQEALALERAPRFELWFLQAGRVVVV